MVEMSEPIEEGNSSQKRGFMLVTSVLVIMVLGIIGAALFMRHTAFMNAVTRNANQIVAFNVAEAGLDQAITSLRNQIGTGQTYSGTGGFVTMNVGNVQGRYQTVVCPPTCSYSSGSGTVTLTQPTSADVYLVESVGQATDGRDITSVHEERTVRAYITKQYDPLFKYAVFSNGVIKMTGNATTDAYDSSLGSYSSQPMQVDGDIRTNSTSAGAIELSGSNVKINGDATIGEGGNVNLAITGDSGTTSKVAGQKIVASSNVTYPVISPDPAATYQTLPASGNLSGSYLTNTLTVDKDSNYVVTGRTIIYTTGVNISGKGTLNMNDNSVPGNLLIYVSGSGDDVSIDLTGQGKLSAAIYAPLATVENKGQGEVFGAIIAAQYKQTGNAALHFDKNLMTLIKDTYHYSYLLKSWFPVASGVPSVLATPTPGPTVAPTTSSSVPYGSTSTTVDVTSSTTPYGSTSTTVDVTSSTTPYGSTSTTVDVTSSTTPYGSTSTTVDVTSSTTPYGSTPPTTAVPSSSTPYGSTPPTTAPTASAPVYASTVATGV
jgi:type II secretory pathway pseudopilin PulG